MYAKLIFLKKEDENDFDIVLAKFEVHFIQKNIIYEKAKLHSSAQQPGESITTFANALYELAECRDLSKKNEEINDTFVIGQDKRLHWLAMFSMSNI